ncbi:MAG: hypothetical protein CL610_16160 [Anaerolineaceae bacterium]|nr:hypothetical protein [Anaerolineaceae bacterium]
MTDPAASITLDKSYYQPGDPVNLTIRAAAGQRATVTVSYLNRVIATFEADLLDGTATVDYTPPPETPRGYGLTVVITVANGDVVAEASTAFDVLDHWIQSPRYGFLTEFAPGRDNIDETMDWLRRYHVNGLQFYDWQYRHETLMPPTSDYRDLLDKQMSLDTIKALIAAAQDSNIAAMPYTAIYGASWSFYEAHPDWALFQYPGRPYAFGDNYLAIMNPAPDSPWTDHLLGEFRRVLAETNFDGIHIDQYGAPMVGLDHDNQRVRLDEAFPAFINATAALVDEARGDTGVTIFNAVRNWPMPAVAPSDQDAVYIEVWEPYRDFIDLHRIVVEAQKLGNQKPVILAAYMSPAWAANVRLANAMIFASGGYHIELGEPGVLLADPYFPKFETMTPTMQQVMQRYYDFRVRYENVLYPGAVDATTERASALSIAGVETLAWNGTKDAVAVIVRQGDDFETFSLVNLLGIAHSYWEQALPAAPTVQHDLHVQVRVSKPVRQVWAASPDFDNIAPQTVPFTTGSDAVGSTISFNLSELQYWQIIVLDYAT